MLIKAEILAAINAVISYCDGEMLKYKESRGNYGMGSMRSTLYLLKYTGDDAQQILQFCYDNGFTNCLDHRFPVRNVIGMNPDEFEYPIQDVCYWGYDQLASRLRCVI